MKNVYQILDYIQKNPNVSRKEALKYVGLDDTTNNAVHFSMLRDLKLIKISSKVRLSPLGRGSDLYCVTKLGKHLLKKQKKYK